MDEMDGMDEMDYGPYGPRFSFIGPFFTLNP